MDQQTLTRPDLRIVNAAAAEAHAATILTNDLIDRLATSNRACRKLREMGYRIVDQDLRMGSKRQRPWVKITMAESQSVAPLMDAADSRPEWRFFGSIKHGCVDFMDVAVLWEVV